MALPTSLPYGLRDVKLTPYTDATCTTLASTSVDLPNSRTLSFAEAEEFQELRGDDKVITTRGRGANVDWDLEAGGLSFEALLVIAGGLLTSSGTTPNQIKTFKKKVTHARPFFQIEGQIISDSGGDVHCKLPRCRATGNIEGEFGDGTFFLTSASGVALPSLVSADVDDLYVFTHNETPVTIA